MDFLLVQCHLQKSMRSTSRSLVRLAHVTRSSNMRRCPAVHPSAARPYQWPPSIHNGGGVGQEREVADAGWRGGATVIMQYRSAGHRSSGSQAPKRMNSSDYTRRLPWQLARLAHHVHFDLMASHAMPWSWQHADWDRLARAVILSFDTCKSTGRWMPKTEVVSAVPNYAPDAPPMRVISTLCRWSCRTWRILLARSLWTSESCTMGAPDAWSSRIRLCS